MTLREGHVTLRAGPVTLRLTASFPTCVKSEHAPCESQPVQQGYYTDTRTALWLVVCHCGCEG